MARSKYTHALIRPTSLVEGQRIVNSQGEYRDRGKKDAPRPVGTWNKVVKAVMRKTWVHVLMADGRTVKFRPDAWLMVKNP
jgi:hypothetical protein